MDNKVLIAKCVTLLFRESLISPRTENSAETVRTVLGDVKISDVGVGVSIERDSLMAMKKSVLDMCSNPYDHVYTVSDLLQEFRISCGHDDKTYDAIRQAIQAEIQEASIKSSIVNIRRAINNHYRLNQTAALLRKASSTFTYEPDTIKDHDQYISELIVQLEGLSLTSTTKDPAVIGELEIGDDEALQQAFRNVQAAGGSDRIYRTGFDGYNEMFQGGLRAGEYHQINALQHKYKTGFSLTLFNQIAVYNTPKTKDLTKKPAMVRISFEDDLANNVQFQYQQLKYSETREFVDVNHTSIEEMQEYVKKRLLATGFKIFMRRVDPTRWTYKSIINYIIDLEAKGYSIEVLALDYLMLVPTTGCITSGPMGTDMRDLIRRIRNFCASKGILCFSPHQLAPDAKNLLRGGTPEVSLVKEIAGKGYTSGSKQLDQELDGETNIHVFRHGKDTYLAVGWAKHRLPTVPDEEAKFFLLKFPKGMPIPDSAAGETIIRKLGGGVTNASPDIFDMA